MGYDCLWSAETQHDSFLPLAVAATVTSKIKLGSNIATVFSRSPMITAMIAWDLPEASGGHFMLAPAGVTLSVARVSRAVHPHSDGEPRATPPF